MASAFASFTLVICLLFFSTLSTAIDLPEIHHVSHDLLPESNTKSDESNTIFLPSEKIKSDEYAQVIPSQPEIPDSKIPEIESDVESSKPIEESSEASDSVPFTMITFRPVNRHMPWRPMDFPSRRGHRCRHNHKFKPWNPRLPRDKIQYGNDMILSNGEERSFDALPNDRIHKIPLRWSRIDRFEPRFTDETGMGMMMMMRPHRHHHERDHDDEHDHHHDHEHEDDHDDEHDHHHDHEHEDDHDHHHDRKHDHEHEDDHDHHHDRRHDHDHDDEHDHHHHKHEHDHEHDHHHEDGGLMKSIRKFLQNF